MSARDAVGRTLPLVLMLSWGATIASAGELTVTDAWRAAVARDPIFATAEAARQAGRARKSEARALWLPTVSATGGVGLNNQRGRTQGAFFSAPGFGATNGVDFQTEVTGGTATQWALVAEQPLFDAARLADYNAQKGAAQIAEVQYKAAQQDLMLRCARAYFDVLNARHRLQAVVHLRAAAEKARAEAQARYDAGDLPVTDLRESQSNADSIDVQALDSRNAVTMSEAAFADLTGLDPADLAALTAATTAQMPAPDTLNAWTLRAMRGSPQLEMQRLALATATAQVDRYSAGPSPRVSLVARLGRTSLRGNGDFGAADITGRESMIGIQATIPLYTGGMRSAQRHEANALVHEAEARLEGIGQQVRQQTRAVWLSLTNSSARVLALQRLQISAASRRDATRLGARIGGRTALELLGAEADYERAGADFRRAQSDWLMAALELKAVAGELGVADLDQLDDRLERATSAVR